MHFLFGLKYTELPKYYIPPYSQTNTLHTCIIDYIIKPSKNMFIIILLIIAFTLGYINIMTCHKLHKPFQPLYKLLWPLQKHTTKHLYLLWSHIHSQRILFKLQYNQCLKYVNAAGLQSVENNGILTDWGRLREINGTTDKVIGETFARSGLAGLYHQLHLNCLTYHICKN